MSEKNFKPLIIIICLIMFTACSTKRKGFIFRNYHALTARDNGYFNAKLKVEEGAKTLSDAHEDKFDRITSRQAS